MHMRHSPELESVLERMKVVHSTATNNPGKSYEQGIRDALHWVLRTKDAPESWPWVPGYAVKEKPDNRAL